jgi:hypothetical protein
LSYAVEEEGRWTRATLATVRADDPSRPQRGPLRKRVVGDDEGLARLEDAVPTGVELQHEALRPLEVEHDARLPSLDEGHAGRGGADDGPVAAGQRHRQVDGAALERQEREHVGRGARLGHETQERCYAGVAEGTRPRWAPPPADRRLAEKVSA